METRTLLYSGKAKSLYSSSEADCCVMEFRDDTSAFDGEKVERLADKGATNNAFNAFIMNRLAERGIPVHFVRQLDRHCSLVRRLEMLPLECVVRNVAAGSLCKRLGLEEGRVLDPPTYELFLKNDALHDPFVNESHALAFGWANVEQLARMKTLTLQVNEVLKPLFLQAGMQLVDFKLEFGSYKGELMLGDEFSPDGCRIWDLATGEKMDKDRFRRGLGAVIENYREVARRLGVPLEEGESS